MYLCFIDESGDTGVLSTQNKESQPAFVLAGLIIHQDKLSDFTRDFLRIKKEFFPDLFEGITHQTEVILKEVKGSELRKPSRLKCAQSFRHVSQFLGRLLGGLEKYDVKLVGRIQIKQADKATSPDAIYTAAIQSICQSFNKFLEDQGALGMAICDSRSHKQDIQTSHSIFTQKFRHEGDNFPRIVEMPTFGRSDNHSGIQAADLICSALLMPFAVNVYCQDKAEELRNKHVQPSYEKLRDKFWRRVGGLQYRYMDDQKGYKVGGVWVTDGLGSKSGRHLFSDPKAGNRPAPEYKLQALTDKFNGPSK